MYEALQEAFKKKGCNSCKSIAIGIQVYLELSEVKKYWDVECEYNSSLERIYLTARKKKPENPSIFIPVEVSEGLSLHDFQNFFQLCEKSTTPQMVYIAIVNSDSTCVFYQISKGLVQPDDESQKGLKDERENLDKKLKKNRRLLEQAALYGIPITLSNTQKKNEAGPS